ncbi:HlyD family secretion protein [Rhodovulum kholense]|uniref:Multidrug resistance efflux pump n=1 Tax=Rhodovulum kholense TaxID=453584 RepID=A0A8E3ARM2_9RHOB|nr:HlyD family secretion protein [Rhodovulum kholense]PTW50604.1 multidrug resistance efflux pump [Rhodovulum kholense]
MHILKHHIPTFLIVLIGLLGVVVVLYAWHLPPFAGDEIRTENAYVRGNVATLSPQIAGYVTEVPVSDFQTVATGDVLVRLDDRTARQTLARAEAELASARAALKANDQDINSARATLDSRKAAAEAARAAVDTARAEWNRQDRLREKGVISAADAEDSQLKLRQAEAALTEALSDVDVAREDLGTAKVRTDTLSASVTAELAAVELAKIDLEHTAIRAPENGRLGQINVRVGQYVTAGSALMSLVSDRIWVIANVKETDLSGLHPGQAVRFDVDALGHRPFAGTVSMLSPATASEFSVLGNSTATGNFTKIAQRLPVRIEIDPGQTGEDRLAPGMSVVVHARRDGNPARP